MDTGTDPVLHLSALQVVLRVQDVEYAVGVNSIPQDGGGSSFVVLGQLRGAGWGALVLEEIWAWQG